MEIRQATDKDANPAANVLRRSITDLCQLDYANKPGRLEQWLANKTPQHVREWLAQSDFLMLLAVDDHAIVGVGAISKDGVILLNYVDPNWRFKGVSSALLSAMEEIASTAGCSETRLESTKTAERFYRARGYQTSRHGPGDGLWLAKTLS